MNKNKKMKEIKKELKEIRSEIFKLINFLGLVQKIASSTTPFPISKLSLT